MERHKHSIRLEVDVNVGAVLVSIFYAAEYLGSPGQTRVIRARRFLRLHLTAVSVVDGHQGSGTFPAVGVLKPHFLRRVSQECADRHVRPIALEVEVRQRLILNRYLTCTTAELTFSQD